MTSISKGNSKYGKLALLTFIIFELFKILLTIPESVCTVLISFAEEIGISADFRNGDKSLSPPQEINRIKKTEIVYFNFLIFKDLAL